MEHMIPAAIHDDVNFVGRNEVSIAPVDPHAVNRMLSQELNELSLDRREQVMEEIHGVKSGRGIPLPSAHGAHNERRQQEDILLQQFQEELDKYYISESCSESNSEFPAYQFARDHGSELIRDRNFQLAFFGRGEGGNCAKRGAIRMLNYLEFVLEVYDTEDVLFRPICLSDLDRDLGAREFMYNNGPLQVLPIQDPSGRRVIVLLRDFGHGSCSSRVRQQVGMYFVQNISHDRDGTVFVFFLHHARHVDNSSHHAEEFRNINRLLQIIPPKFIAVHLCCPEGPVYDIAKALVTLLIGKENRERLRFHSGSYLECKYNLKTFGIPISRLPVDLNFKERSLSRLQTKDMRNHQRWLGMREAKETIMFAAVGRDSSGKRINEEIRMDIGESYTGVMEAVKKIESKFVECPRQEDCLFGKGRPAMNHPGNVAMRRLVEDGLDRFNVKSSKNKSNAVWKVVAEIKEWNGRFLKEDYDHAGLFVVADDQTVFKKIASAFRDLKKKRLRRDDGLKKSHTQSQSEQLSLLSASGTKRPSSAMANIETSILGSFNQSHMFTSDQHNNVGHYHTVSKQRPTSPNGNGLHQCERNGVCSFSCFGRG
mmetsp:Transcript_5086/g.14753  ORF Transcript_5086/g.14753 Transcript_5086/m.14753 type:complete len:596 (+) Transcript_5086:130-1917(+)